METEAKALLVSVGGSPAPIVVSINRQRPEFLCFFTSEQTKESVLRDILPALEYPPKHFDWIVTPSAEGMTECCRMLNAELPKILAKWGLGFSDLGVDYTGGTKTMSAAVVLATIDRSSRYSYVGGLERDKQGVGVVVDGKERVLYRANPWDELAVAAKAKVALLFNSSRYEAAEEECHRVAPLVATEWKSFWNELARLIQAYGKWDRFDHRGALQCFPQSLGKLTPYAAGGADSALVEFLSQAAGNHQTLEALVKGEAAAAARLALLDLIANASRRADQEGRFDDACARLYRSLEMLSQNRLRFDHGIDTSDVKPECIPAERRELYRHKYCSEDEGKVQLPLAAAFGLLQDLGDELGTRFTAGWEQIRKVLSARNDSILAHGGTSLRKETYESMRGLVLDFAEIAPEELPQFPRLGW